MKRFPWRSIFYLLVLGYLFLDLKCCNGPLRRKISETRPSSDVTRERAVRNGWVGLVNQEPVPREQLALAVSRHLYQRGIDRKELSSSRILEIRRAVLHRLIDDILISQYADGDDFAAAPGEIQAFIEAWKRQFPSEKERRQRTRLQGLSESERDAELARIWSRKQWLEKRIEPGINVSEERIRQFYETGIAGGSWVEPEKVKARHIFVSTLEEDSSKQRQEIEKARQRVLDGEPFAEVARDLSDDERTKDRGGELNWFSRTRLPPDLAEAIFAQPVGEIGQPFKAEIGWHLVEVLEKEGERQVAFEEVREEIRSLLINQQKRETVKELLVKLRRVANIVIFSENIENWVN